MDRSTILNKVKTLTAQHLKMNVEDIFEDTAFLSDLKVDSLQLLELIVILQESFDIEFPEDELMEITTIRQAVNKIKEGLSRRNASGLN